MSAMHYTTTCIITFFLYISVSEVQSGYDYDYDLGENEPKNCTTSESIIGGTVEYSNGGVVGSRIIYHCSDGFEPYPISQKVCSSDGEWEPRVSRVKCEETSDYGDYEEPQKNCSLEVSIKGGSVVYSNEGLEGSVMTYHCKAAHYPFPVTQRVCDRDGQWSAMRLPNGKITLNAVCKEILCPAQLQLDNGQFWPRKQWFKFGEKQTFSCHEGFDLIGSAERNCTQWGGWTGATPVCDDQSEDCKNPGAPPGALRSGERFRIGDRVRYLCQFSLDLLGPSERQCLDSREWSGAEPRCYAQYSFDQPDTVAQAFGGSLTAVMDVSHPNFKKKGQNLGRTVRVEEGRLNVFILMDTSGSILEDNFKTAKTAIVELVRKLDSYEVHMKFEIISYASEPKEIVSITSIESQDVHYILRKLEEFNYKNHESKRGTNLYKALERVYSQLAFLKETKRNQFNETQNVVIIATDGHSNMGPNPQTMLAKIRNLFGYKPSSVDHTHEELLDVYVFAVKGEVNKKDLTSIASSKKDELHFFILKDYKHLGYVFNRMISDSAVTKCGVAQEQEEEKPETTYTRPWHVDVLWIIFYFFVFFFIQGAKTCRGTLVTKSMVLTAAHCLIKVNTDESVSIASSADITVHHGNGEVKAMELIVHPLFNVKGLKHKNVNEFYDYDIALVRMRENITISLKTRPICLPCTKSSNRALRMDPDSTCRSLLHLEETPAHFIRQGTRRSDTHIHSGAKRGECLKKARSTFPANSSASLSEVITDRFMCTGGTETIRHEMTCKGDSGGALFLRKRMRYFQVAVISWGTKQTCGSRTAVRDSRPLDARDFHISVFTMKTYSLKGLAAVLSLAQHSKGGCHLAACSETAGRVRDLNPGPLAPKARIIPLDQRAWLMKDRATCMKTYSLKGLAAVLSLAQHSKGGCQLAACSETAGLVRDLNSGPLAPKARIIPLDQRAWLMKDRATCMKTYSLKGLAAVLSLAQHSKGGCQLAACSETAGLVRDLNPGPLAPKARIIPLDQRAWLMKDRATCVHLQEVAVEGPVQVDQVKSVTALLLSRGADGLAWLQNSTLRATMGQKHTAY
ncbi:unnamed protein product [Leuciscus chuanchicus]